MLIFSQDKMDIINFSNTVRLSADVNTNGEFLIEAHNSLDDFETVIGLYKTKERAQEILQEIKEEYKKCNMDSSFGHYAYVQNRVYEMPAE